MYRGSGELYCDICGNHILIYCDNDLDNRYNDDRFYQFYNESHMGKVYYFYNTEYIEMNGKKYSIQVTRVQENFTDKSYGGEAYDVCIECLKKMLLKQEKQKKEV